MLQPFAESVALRGQGTEILFALGMGDAVVGVSHECDVPAEARRRPVLTGSALQPGMSPTEIDADWMRQLSPQPPPHSRP